MPTLITVRGDEIALTPNRSYSMGRALDNDVVVADVISSRYHARLTVGEAIHEVWIEDLGSKNGTWVNEVCIGQKTLLADGASIRIGATAYLLNVLDAAGTNLRPMLETGTIGIDTLEPNRPMVKLGAAGTDFAGQIGSFSLVEVLQLLAHTRRSGTLHLALTGGAARIELTHGEVDAAEFDNLTGFDALVALAHQTQGLFWLVGRRIEAEKTINLPSSQLLLELCSAIDEADR